MFQSIKSFADTISQDAVLAHSLWRQGDHDKAREVMERTLSNCGYLRDAADRCLQDLTGISEDGPMNDLVASGGIADSQPHLVCPSCRTTNQFVNQCGCDPNNMPTRVIA